MLSYHASLAKTCILQQSVGSNWGQREASPERPDRKFHKSPGESHDHKMTGKTKTQEID